MRLFSVKILIGLGLLLLAQAALAQNPVTVVLKQGVDGYTGCTDTYINSQDQTANYGNLFYMHLYIANHGPARRRGLIRFDLDGIIPQGATVTSATLSMYVYQLVDMTGSDWMNVGPFRIRGTRNWLEMEATWIYSRGTTYWASAGCDHTTFDRYEDADSLIHFTRHSPVGLYYHWNVTSSVQHWHSGAETNRGWLMAIDSHDGGTEGLSLYTRESSTLGHRPYLTIQYTPAEAVSTPSTPSGPTEGLTNELLNYTTGGSTCNHGHAVQYRFDWGDGSYSSWGSSMPVGKAWPVEGVYQVRAQARCAVNQHVVSDWSGSLGVTISEPVRTDHLTWSHIKSLFQ